MTYILQTSSKGHYLHARVTGPNTIENVLGYLQELESRCREADCPYLLIEEALDGPRQDMASVFEIASESSATQNFDFITVAYVDVNAETELMEFAETVAVNRAVPVKVFGTVTDAENWLIEEC